VDCSAHPGSAASGTCGVCKKAGCDTCLTYEVDGTEACAACGAACDAQSQAIGSTLLAFIGVAYLATLAIGFLVFRARPFIGGLAAVVAFGCGRTLQAFVQQRTVTRRAIAPRTG
jgi:hypothetical protein